MFSEIGKLKIELDWLKKTVRESAYYDASIMDRKEQKISVVCQCEWVGVTHSTVYAPRRAVDVDETELWLCRLINEEYTRRPVYGNRRRVVLLKGQGHEANRKRVQLVPRFGRQ